MGFPLDWGGRIGWNREGEFFSEVALFISSSLTSGILKKLPSAVRGTARAVGWGSERTGRPRAGRGI